MSTTPLVVISCKFPFNHDDADARGIAVSRSEPRPAARMAPAQPPPSLVDGMGFHSSPAVDQLFMLPTPGGLGVVPAPIPPGSLQAQLGAQLPPAHSGRPAKPPPRACPHPGCSFVTEHGRARLEKHVLTHRTDKPFACAREGCGKSFKTREHLRQHERTHTVERLFRCDRALCVDHAAFKSAAEVALHAKRVHTLDKAEARELKLRDRVRKMERDADALRADADVLRAAVDVLTAALKTAARRKRQRKTAANANANDAANDAARRSAEGDDSESLWALLREDADAGAERGGRPESSRGPGDGDGDIPGDGKGKKRKKPYTVSAANVLRAAEQAAEAALRATEERWAEDEERRDRERERRRGAGATLVAIPTRGEGRGGGDGSRVA